MRKGAHLYALRISHYALPATPSLHHSTLTMRCPACGHDNLPGLDECTSCLNSLMQEDVPQPTTPLEATIMGDPVTSLAGPAPEAVPLGTPLAQAIGRMQEQNIGYLLVIDSAGKLVGIFTERDLIRKVAGQEVDLASTPVERVMTPNPSSLKAADPVAQALHLMAVEPGYRYIPIVDDQGRPQGLVSFRRICRLLESPG